MPNHEHEQFVQEMIAAQSRLYALVLAMTANRQMADDVLQETNLVLLRKEQDFELGTNFFAWAAQVAAYQVQNHRKKQGRDRLRFDDTLVEHLADEAQFALPARVDRDALRECLDKLSAAERDLIRRRYSGASVRQLAEERGRSAASISQSIYRSRGNLADCMRRVIAREERA
jgi:RNA polymerase sigma-70 factor (ECF subfamily)